MARTDTRITKVTDVDGAKALAEHLLAPGRTRPLVLVTTPLDHPEPYIDVREVARELGGSFDYAVAVSGQPTRALEAALPHGASVYGGGARVYPVDPDWATLRSTHPLVLCTSRAGAAEATRRVVRDGQRIGVTSTSAPEEPTPGATAVVRRVFPPSTAMLETPTGDVVNLDLTGLRHPVDVDRLVQEGQTVTGRLVGRTLMPEVDPSAVGVDYQVGQVVLARVAQLQPDQVVVELLPWVRGVVHRDDATADPAAPLSRVLDVGQVVRGRVLRVGEPAGRPWRLGLLGVDGDEPVVPPPALLHGGPPWLSVEAPVDGPEVRDASQRDERVDEPEVDEPEHQAPEVTTDVQDGTAPAIFGRLGDIETHLGELRREVAALRTAQESAARAVVRAPGPGQRGVELLREERDEARMENEALLTRLRTVEEDRDRQRAAAVELRREVRAARRDDDGTGEADQVFLDPEEDFRWRVQAAWVSMIPAAEKKDLPLGEYVVLPDFLESVRDTPGIEVSKVVEVVVHIATGRIHELAGRQTHQLRESESSDRFVTREDGATCWRVALQVSTPGARRLHFWQPPGGRPPELSSVRLHDDSRP